MELAVRSGVANPGSARGSELCGNGKGKQGAVSRSFKND